MLLLNSIKKVFFSIPILLLALVATPKFSQAAEDSAAAPAATAAAPDAAAAGASPLVEKGKTLFEDNCKSCHAVKTIEVGPALKGIEQRRDRKWLHAWIKNSQKVIASGDPYATKLFAEYKGAVMTSFPSFSDEEINSILDYIKAEENKKDEVKATAGGGAAVKADDSSAGYVKILLAGFVIVLLLIVLVLVLVLSVVKRHLVTKNDLTDIDKDLVNQKFDIGAVVRSTGFKLIVGFLFVSFVGKTALDGLMHIGMQQGYAPSQPIAFSHKLHAGKFKIDCNYCHTGVRKGKSANIPSPNICLNCHSQIKTTSPKLEALRNAVKNNKPIEWVRVHNLPDLAYFNHSQHVVVGKLECQTCHGPVEKMEVIQQYSPLTMGWCINCHRETDVKTEGNGYYDKLVRLHAEKNGAPMKVKDMGGLECSKCHY
ncbi:MAG: hypothetical protein RL711_634 [Bacteroidota bacterium]